MGRNVYRISLIFIVLFSLFIGNLVVSGEIEDIEERVEFSDLGCTWEYINIDGWAKLNGNGVADSEDEAYIILEDVVYKPSWSNWRVAISNMEKEFKKQGGTPTISSTLVGYQDGKLDKKEQWKLCKEILSKMKATRLKIVEEEKFISTTGYTSMLEDCYITSDGPVNINVATRYNSFEDKTYIFIGSPIINVEY